MDSSYSLDVIKSIDESNTKLEHFYSTEYGSSGAPIINSNNHKVFGIHLGHKNDIINIGTILRKPIDEFNNLNKKILIDETGVLNDKKIEKISLNESNKSKGKQNKITLILVINEEDINKDIYFLDRPKTNKYEIKESNYNDYFSKMNISDIKLYINKEEKEFQKYYKPLKKGIYTIEILFNIDIKDCSYMFYGCDHLAIIDLSSFDTENATSFRGMFSGCHNLTNIDLSYLNTKNVNYMSSMFRECRKLESLNLSSFDTKNVTSMMGMFFDCGIKEIDLSSFNTEKVENMSFMFGICHDLRNITFSSSFNTKNVYHMRSMFDCCCNLIQLNLSSFDTTKVNYMELMFRGCSNLIKLDLSSFNTKNVVCMFGMFSKCRNIEKLNLSFFDTRNVTSLI